jgi:hypothetical protein
MKDDEWCAAEGIPSCVLELARAWERDHFERTGTEHDVRALAKTAAKLRHFDVVFLGDHVSRTLKKLEEAKARGEKWSKHDKDGRGSE